MNTSQRRASRAKPRYFDELPDAHEYADERAEEAERLRGEHAVLLSLLCEADAVLATLDPDDSAESEQLAALRAAIDAAIQPHRHPGALL